MGFKNKRSYPQEFKVQSVKLANEIGIGKASTQLGVPSTTLRQWSEKFSKDRGLLLKPGAESTEEELRRLRKENADLKKSNLILKSAAAFFSQDHLK